MDYREIIEIDNGIEITGVNNFEMDHTLYGQCFRWKRNDDGSAIGIAMERVIELDKKEDTLRIYNTNLEEFNNIWLKYFDFTRDYTEIKKVLSKDAVLKEAIKFADGIRILNQDKFELILTFIISANNRIPMIERAVEKISNLYGKEIEYNNKKYYTFPKIKDMKDLSLEDYEKLGVGFRAKYLYNTVRMLSENGEEYLDYISNLSMDNCHKELQKLSGVGPKVADCIMLFSMGKTAAFPVDVWIKKAMIFFYNMEDMSLNKIREESIKMFGENAGLAQQYLFYYARENNINI